MDTAPSASAPLVVVNGIHHVALSVPDMETARHFYVDLLGFEVVSEGAWADAPGMDLIVGLRGSAGKSMMIRAANIYIELFEYRSPVPEPRKAQPKANHHGYTHLCFDVSDADAVYERLREKGFNFNSDPQSRAGVRTVYGRDPFGNIIEFQQIVTEGRVRRLPALADAALLQDPATALKVVMRDGSAGPARAQLGAPIGR